MRSSLFRRILENLPIPEETLEELNTNSNNIDTFEIQREDEERNEIRKYYIRFSDAINLFIEYLNQYIEGKLNIDYIISRIETAKDFLDFVYDIVSNISQNNLFDNRYIQESSRVEQFNTPLTNITENNLVIIKTIPKLSFTFKIITNRRIDFVKSELLNLNDDKNLIRGYSLIFSNYNYEKRLPIIIVKGRHTEIFKLYLKIPNFDKNWILNFRDIPDYVYYKLEDFNYTALIHYFCYIAIKSLSYDEFMKLIAISHIPVSILEEQATSEILDFYERYKTVKKSTNIIHEVINTLNRTINPQVTLEELLTFLITGEKSKELQDWEESYNKAVSNIPKIELVFDRQQIINETYEPISKFVEKRTHIYGVSENGLEKINKTKVEYIDINSIIKSLPLLKSKIIVINGEIPTFNIISNTEVEHNIPHLETNKDVLRLSIPTSTWEDAINLSNQFNNIKIKGITISAKSYGNYNSYYDLLTIVPNPQNVSISINLRNNEVSTTLQDIMLEYINKD